MTPTLIISLVLGYFLLLIGLSFLTSGKGDNEAFFTGNRQSPWYIVAFGMIGASLSGVTFISVPGTVGSDAFSYMQVVFGYLVGYFVIANVLMPLYYRLELTSIYTYLEQRFGFWSYKTGAFYFLLSRIIGASFRLFLVAIVLDEFVFAPWGIPFWVTVAITITLIWVYSFKGGIKTIIWTDTLQTTFMLLAMGLSIYFLSKEMDLSLSGMINTVAESHYSDMFVWDINKGNNFFKHFISGAFISIVMTGLDQDMMQKNLTCRNIGEAKKNMYWMSSLLVPVNLCFLALGALLFLYANQNGIIVEHFGDPNAACVLEAQYPGSAGMTCIKKDELYPLLSIHYLPTAVGVLFIIGLIAAAYSSADSALTALTTSFCVDFLGFNKSNQKTNTRKLVHVGFSVILFLTILIFRLINNDSVILEVFTAAGYTYGPLLGLYAFGLFTKLPVKDKFVPIICILSPLMSYVISANSAVWFNGFKFGFFILIVNGVLTFLGLLVVIDVRN